VTVDITRAAIEKNRITAVALLVVVLGGIFTYLGMPRAEDPGFIIRTAQVITYFPGASPERVEQLVTDKLEEVIQEIPELDFVNSTSKTGVSIVMVNIKESYTDMRPLWDDLRRKVEKVEGDLPDGIIGPIVNDEFGDVFGIVVGLTGEGFSYAELKDLADEVRDELLLREDAAKVDIYGAQDERVFVEYSNARLSELGLSPNQLAGIIQNQNIIIPGGDILVGPERIALEPTGNFESVEELRRTVIQVPGLTDLIELGDIAHIHRDYIDPPSSITRASGTPALMLAVSMREGGNIISLGEQVREDLDRLHAIYPHGVEFEVIAFQPDDVDKKVRDFVSNLLQAVAVVVLVMLLTLGLRTGLVVASLIPTAILFAFLIMDVFSIGMDQISLAALIIALGLLVDNAIVMSESIMTQMAEGKEPLQAAVDTAAELRVPLLISSLTTAAAFLTIFLAESAVGEFTAPLFKVVTITLLCSWVLALTMTPLLCVLFIKVKRISGEQSFDTRLYRSYRVLLLAALRRPLVSALVALLMFVLAIQGLGLVPKIFFPPSDKPMITAELELPIGTDIRVTETMVDEVESFIRTELMAVGEERNGIVKWGGFIGQGGPRFNLGYGPEPAAPNYAMLLITTSNFEVNDEIIRQLESFCFSTFPDVKTTIAKLGNGPPVDNPVAVRLLGKDSGQLFSMVDEVKTMIREIPGTRNIGDDWGQRTKKLVVDIDEDRARRAGVTNQDIAISLQAGLSGLQMTEYREGDKVIPVTLRSEAADRQDLAKLESISVYAQSTGESVPLQQVADIEMFWEPSKVIRRDRLRTVTVTSALTADVSASEVVAVLIPRLEEAQAGWGPGYRFEMGGEYESSGKANASIFAQLPTVGLIILVLLVGQFNSFRRTFIVLTTIPLGLVGVTAGLLITGASFGFMALLGLISLAGIVINNAIVLLERIKLEIEENGLEPHQAVVTAAQRRLRPILLTTATTMGGLIPLWLGGGAMWESMAIAIIFGLLFGTLLTLLLVPVLYALLFRVRFQRS